MAQHPSHVPKFGNWKEDGNPLYTAVFETARAVKGTKGTLINPNDPQQNPSGFAEFVQKAPITSSNAESCISEKPRHPGKGADSEINGQRNSKRTGRDEGDMKHHVEMLVTNSNKPARKSFGESPVHQQRGRYGSGGSSRSIHAGERKGSVEGGSLHAPSTPGRKFRAGKEANEASSPLPKFGAWNENPASADGFTFIFNRAREERQHGVMGKIPKAPSDNSHGAVNTPRKGHSKKSIWCCCFTSSAS